MTTETDTAVDSYVASRIGDVVDDNVYTWRGMWADKPAMEDLNIGNLIIIEDFPPYVGSVWKRAAVPVIFPVAGVQAVGLLTDVEVPGDDTEQELMGFQFPVDGFFHGTFFDVRFKGEKAGVSESAILTVYAQAWDDNTDAPSVAKTEIFSMNVANTDRIIDEQITLKLIQDGSDWNIRPLLSSIDRTASYPGPVTLPEQATANKMMTILVTYQCDGEALALHHASASFNAG